MVPASALLSSGAPSIRPVNKLKRDILFGVSVHSNNNNKKNLNMMNEYI